LFNIFRNTIKYIKVFGVFLYSFFGFVGDMSRDISRDDIFDAVEKERIEFIRLQFVDILGTPKNIVVPTGRLEGVLDEGMAFDASSIVGYATIDESDMIAKPVPSSMVVIPKDLEGRRTARFTCDVYEPSGKRFRGDPKYILERVEMDAEELGFSFNTGPECEFFLLRKENGEINLVPNDTGGYFDISPLDMAENVRGDISSTLQEMGFAISTLHHEAAGGQHEINFEYDDAMTTADRVLTLKYVTKAVALRHGLHATFMPKPIFGKNGSGMHTHMSLIKDGKNAFYDPDSELGLGKTALHFIGGLMAHVREASAILNPSVNSYKRLVPGFEAPAYVSWGMKNRSAMIRIPADRGMGTRVELRNPDPSGNPYLQFAVMLSAGLDGIKNQRDPPPPVESDIYTMSLGEREKLGIKSLPDNLGHALSYIQDSAFMKEVLGEHIHHHFQVIKNKEWNEYRMHVSQWEIDNLLPVL